MSIIEGVGDEVTHFFSCLIIVLIVCIAWWTTNISERRTVRTIFLLDGRRIHRRLTNHTEAVTIVEGSGDTDSRRSEDTDVEDNEMSSELERNRDDNTSLHNGTRSDDEEGIIIRQMDENADIRQRRCHYYDSRPPNPSGDGRPTNSSDNKPVNPSGASNEDGEDKSNLAKPSELESHTSPSEEDAQASGSSEKIEESKNKNVIRIKLKYINDDLKLVDGGLNEQLGDFKRRHFETELQANKSIRLIFNGQVLQPDSVTLKMCGLFDNCVVHCLVHQKRSTSNGGSNTSNTHSEYYSATSSSRIQTNNNNTQREWDLGNFLFGVLSFFLVMAWYFRYAYAHLYTITATVGLVMLTTTFLLALVGMYFPTTEHFYQRTQRT